MTDQDLCYISATEALKRFRAKELSPVELMQALIERTAAVEPSINAFTYTLHEQALEQARAAEAKYATGARTRPLEGIPVAIKDETSIKGQRTTSGSLTLKDNIDTTTALCAERILRAGAIVHARSTAPEFACAAVTHSRLWGVTRNPWNPEYTPGGSSGGAGASLAAGTTTLANGSDIGGSIRIPASCCGVVGFKPPYGRVPEDSPFNLDFYCHEGPMGRTVADVALLENVMAGPHPKDIVSIRPKLRIPDQLGDIRGWKIAYSPDLGYCEVDPEVAKNTKTAVDTFRELGATVEEVDLGWSWTTLTAALNHLHHIFGAYISGALERHRHELTNYARAFGEGVHNAPASAFLSAMSVANEMYSTLGPILEKYNVLICPTNALPAVAADHDSTRTPVHINGVEVEPVLGWVMTYPFNMMSRCPVMSMPSGHADNGVPTGIQIVGKTYDDVSVFRAAAAFESLRPNYDTTDRRPKL